MKILICILVVIVIIILININGEHFTNTNTLTITDQFPDVIIYENDGDRLGLDKCIENCNGNCIEFGITGTGWCFPNNTFIYGNFTDRSNEK